MIQKPFDEITAQDVLHLVATRSAEGRTLEYKQDLPAAHKKVNFLALVSAMANASGGDIVYGVVERKDAQNKNTGEPESAPGLAGVNVDEGIRRLQNWVAGGIEPMIPGIRAAAVGDLTDGPAIVIRVPRSWAAPHMVHLPGDGVARFYLRMTAQNIPLDREGIRQQFFLADASRSRLERFRDDRLGRVLVDETPVTLRAGWRLVLHVVPLGALDAATPIDLNALARSMKSAALHGRPQRHNFDGIVFGSGEETYDPNQRYLQLFRNGAMEYVMSSGPFPDHPERLAARVYEEYCIETLAMFLGASRQHEIQPPAFVMLAMLGVKGKKIETGQRLLDRNALPIDRDNLVVPETVVNDYMAKADQVLRPAFDVTWQASGHPRCMLYDTDGNRLVLP